MGRVARRRETEGGVSRLRVLTVGHSYVVALNQAVPKAIARDGRIELTLAAPRFHYGDLRRLRLEKTADPDYEIVPLGARLTRWNHVFWYDRSALRRLLRDGRFDLVHIWEEPYTVAGYQLARAACERGYRFVFRTAQSIVKRYPWPFSRFERYSVERAAGWVAGGQLVYEAMVAKGFPAARGRVITLGVDGNAFRPLTAAQREAVLRELRLAPPVVGFVGRLVAAKGLDVLMAALERVPPPWSLLVLGAGPYRERLLAWAEARQIRDRVRVQLVPHGDVPHYLGALDLLLAPSQTTPSWKEQFGRMVIEAFACRVAVIGSDSGEIPHVIGDAGIVLPERDVDAWAEAVRDLLGDQARRDALAERGFRRCRERYEVSRVAEQYLALYHELCGAA